jgi:hypothetical protein
MTQFEHNQIQNNGGLAMPGVDSRVFSFALSVFLVFGAAHLTVELMISLVVLCKKLTATMQSHYSLESGKLEAPGSLHRDEFPQMNASLLAQVMALSPTDRQIISSLLDALSRNAPPMTRAEERRVTQNSADGQDEDLGWLRFSGAKSNSNLTH